MNEQLMRLALAEAEKGRGRTHPNPIVGAVVARGDEVIAVGHHARAGLPHAEVVALRKAGARARGAELYVTLEPCNHHGRTPPCTEAIIASGVRHVIIGSKDPNPAVVGGGIERLQEAGVEVSVDVLAYETDASHENWTKFITTSLPWVILKAAVTLDGKLATATGDSKWVSGPKSRALGLRWRDQNDAILIGVGTAEADDPRLTARFRGGRNPARIVVDSNARMSPDARMLRIHDSTTFVAVGQGASTKALEAKGARIITCKRTKDGRVDLKDLLKQLGAMGVTSLLVEGGAAIHGTFLKQKLWDELRLFLTPRIAGASGLSWAGFPGGKKMDQALQLSRLWSKPVGADLLVIGRPMR
jgi:diaminohydroxyphosphoribosylaminopyrimidine deaminase/5-amino-6-(5-phosphoribosylamino)uracil reductase